MYDLTRDLATPALCALGGKGKLGSNTNNWLSTAFCLADDPAAAPLRFLALGEAVVTKRMLCLDPINFAFVERNVSVGDPNDLHLTAAEAQSLRDSLREIFAEIGEIRIKHKGLQQQPFGDETIQRWQTGDGQRADQGLTTDPQWRKLLNEAQILLHAHPINQARESRGQPRVNSLWPWGGGSLPSDANTRLGVVKSNNPIL